MEDLDEHLRAERMLREDGRQILARRTPIR